jgi:hypothetical protein
MIRIQIRDRRAEALDRPERMAARKVATEKFRAQIVELITTSTVPLSSCSIAEHIGTTRKRTLTLIRGLRDDGMVLCLRAGSAWAEWSTPERVAAITALRNMAHEAEEAKAKTRRERLAKSVADKARIHAANILWGDLAPSTRTVSARSCLPVRTKAVNSVFALGSAV